MPRTRGATSVRVAPASEGPASSSRPAGRPPRRPDGPRLFPPQSNRLTKIEGLQGLVNLRELYLSHNGIEVLEGLENNVRHLLAPRAVGAPRGGHGLRGAASGLSRAPSGPAGQVSPPCVTGA